MGMWSVSLLPKGRNQLPMEIIEKGTEVGVVVTHGNLLGASAIFVSA